MEGWETPHSIERGIELIWGRSRSGSDVRMLINETACIVDFVVNDHV